MANKKQLTSNSIFQISRERGWNYIGDCNIEHGGYFWKWTGEEKETAKIIRVSFIDDCELLEIEQGQVDIPEGKQEQDNCLSTCGWEGEWSEDGEETLLSISQSGDEISGDSLKDYLLDSKIATWGVCGDCETTHDEEKLLERLEEILNY